MEKKTRVLIIALAVVLAFMASTYVVIGSDVAQSPWIHVDVQALPFVGTR